MEAVASTTGRSNFVAGGCLRGTECCLVSTLWWRIPRAQLDPTKPFRWRIHTHYPGHTDDGDDDFAPDAGWHP